jgi:hypothetical protein
VPQYTENHLLLRFGGPAYAGGEEWSCGLRLRAPNDDDPANLLQHAQDIVESVATLCVGYVTDQDAGFSGASALRTVSLNPISAATGKYLYPNQPVEFDLGGNVTSSLAAGYPQVAYCVTLRSSLYSRGPASRGRWYVPMTIGSAYSVTSTGVLPAQTCTDAARTAGEFLTNLATLAGPTDPVSVIPWLYGDGVGGAKDSPIDNCYVGNVVDTQRRRRNQLEETYFPGAYDPV